ncbi:MAG TPA: ferrochelatase, partial [Limnochordia bacterium]|nr:ferrochelatase [Limnochordia bacterium]
MSQPSGVLLMAYGSPERPEDVEAYYTHIRGGRRPTPEQLAALQARYARIAGRPSLNAITREQAAGVQRALDAAEPGRFRVYVGMKHWHPYIADTVAQMERDGIRQAVSLVLAPHYSQMSVAVYQQAAREAASQLRFTAIEH